MAGDAPTLSTMAELIPPSGDSLEEARRHLHLAKVAHTMAWEHAKAVALLHVGRGESESSVARALNVDRMTVRRWLGKR